MRELHTHPDTYGVGTHTHASKGNPAERAVYYSG